MWAVGGGLGAAIPLSPTLVERGGDRAAEAVSPMAERRGNRGSVLVGPGAPLAMRSPLVGGGGDEGAADAG